MGRKIAFKTLGCRLNQYETDSLMSDFVKGGYEVVGFSEVADAYVVNTCTVTNTGDHKSRQAINQALRRNENAVLVVTGCMADSQKRSLDTNDRITYTVTNDRKGSVFQLLDGHFRGKNIHPDALKADRFAFGAAEKSFHTRSLIKIQDGCDNFCTFCIVPHVRGRAESRPYSDIERNIREVLDFGYKEIVLTGVNIGRYEHEELGFEDIVEKILEIPGDFRVRISSIEPEGFGDKLVNLFEHPRLTPHLHLCLQSGSDRILMKMRRRYSVADFMNLVEKIRWRVPGFNFTTDIMVGFPGETDDDFRKTCTISEEAGFSHIHTFKYSRRKGTRADRMTDQVPERIKTERSAMIREISEKNKRSYRSSFPGKTQTVLVERIDGRGHASGYGEHYVPVRFRADEKTRLKHFRQTRITGMEDSNDPALIAMPSGAP